MHCLCTIGSTKSVRYSWISNVLKSVVTFRIVRYVVGVHFEGVHSTVVTANFGLL